MPCKLRFFETIEYFCHFLKSKVLISHNHKIESWKKVFLKATAKFDSRKVFMTVNSREILSEFQIAKIYAREISEKKFA